MICLQSLVFESGRDLKIEYQTLGFWQFFAPNRHAACSNKEAIKSGPTLMDSRGHIPSFFRITDSKTHEVNVLDDLMPEPGAFYLIDRGYLDFARLFGAILNRFRPGFQGQSARFSLNGLG